MSDDFTCPHLICPRCRSVKSDYGHPSDGLAGSCYECDYPEWWAAAGPHMDGRCPQSAAELQEWHAYDSSILQQARGEGAA